MTVFIHEGALLELNEPTRVLCTPNVFNFLTDQLNQARANFYRSLVVAKQLPQFVLQFFNFLLIQIPFRVLIPQFLFNFLPLIFVTQFRLEWNQFFAL